MTIHVTISGPQGSGKTQLLKALRTSWMRKRSKNLISATRLEFIEIQSTATAIDLLRELRAWSKLEYQNNRELDARVDAFLALTCSAGVITPVTPI